MAIRDKLKAKFSKNKTSSDADSSPKTGSIEEYYTGRTDIEYYKPNEIPKSKYRGRVDKAHQEKLDSFSFTDAFAPAVRRASAALSGTFSPGGTKAFSRRTSYNSNLGAQTPARSRRSSLSSDANNSFSIPNSESASTHMKSIAAVMTPGEFTLTEQAGDDTAETDNIASAGTSELPIIQLDRMATVTGKDSELHNNHIEFSQTSDEMPFTAEELNQAMTRASLVPQITTRQTSVAVAAA